MNSSSRSDKKVWKGIPFVYKYFTKNGVVVEILQDDVKQLMMKTTYKEIESAFNKKSHFHKPRIVTLASQVMKECEDGKVLMKIPKYIAGYPFKQKLYPIELSCHIKLHEQQKKYFQIMKETLREKQGLCLNLSPGTGKTVLAIKLIATLKLRTVIIVHKEFLRDQWIDSIIKFTSLTRDDIGIIQGNSYELDKPITVAMLQTLWKKKDVPIKFNLLIVDEVHNIGADAFFNSLTTALPMCKYTLGLSGTTDRVDGMSPLFEAYLGAIIKPQNGDKVTKLVVQPHFLDSEDDAYKVKTNRRTGTIDIVSMTTALANYLPRIKYICNILQDNYEGNQILVLSERVSMLDILSEMLTELNIEYTCNYGKNRTYKSNCNGIILATYSMASEAFDVQDLNMLILASGITSRNRFLQSVGRINRNSEVNKSDKIIIDIIDSPLRYQYKKRLTLLESAFKLIKAHAIEVNV